MTSHSNLQTLWFTLIAVLWIGYFFLEGFDFGVGILLRKLGKDESERQQLIRTIGPFWDGNEVWLLVAGGATFAAFPQWYATMFSSFYLALFAILVALIFRNVAIELRAKTATKRWRNFWDWCIVLGSALPALLWGVAFGDILAGVPVENNEYVGNFLHLLQPYALVAGLTTLALFTLHGAVFLTLRTDDDMADRARRIVKLLAWPTTLLVFAFLTWSYLNANSAENSGIVPPFIPVTALLLVAGVDWLARTKHDGWAFFATGSSIALVTATIFLNLYPRVFVSSLGASHDLTIFNSSSSHYTLGVMSIVALAFLPLVLAYQAWTYWVFRHRVSKSGFGDVSSPIDLLAKKKPPATADSDTT